MPSDMGLKLARELRAFCVSGLVMKSVSFMVPHNSSSGWPRSNEDISFAVRILEEESIVSTALFGLTIVVGKTVPQLPPPTKLRKSHWPLGALWEVPNDPLDSPGEKLKLWRPLPGITFKRGAEVAWCNPDFARRRRGM